MRLYVALVGAALLSVLGIGAVILLTLDSNRRIVNMTERRPEPKLLQKFVSDGVETLRYEGESMREALERHMLRGPAPG